MLKSSPGVILIEMLVSVAVVGVIVLLILNLLLLISSAISYDQLISKVMQTTSLMTTDIAQAVSVEVTTSCMVINQNVDEVKYCIEDDLTRTVNDAGYERLVSNFDGKYIDGDVIYLDVKTAGNEMKVPIWSNDE